MKSKLGRTCSAKALLILFLLIISFLDSTFIANSLSVFFSRTRYTLPTSPLPKSLTLWKLFGPISTLRTRIEDDEYVRRKAARGGSLEMVTGRVGGSWSLDAERVGRNSAGMEGDGGMEGTERDRAGDALLRVAPDDRFELAVASDVDDDFGVLLVLVDGDCSDAPESLTSPTGMIPTGRGGIGPAGERNPFLVDDAEEEEEEEEKMEPLKSAFALGADATRRRNLVVDDTVGERGVGPGCEVMRNEWWVGLDEWGSPFPSAVASFPFPYTSVTIRPGVPSPLALPRSGTFCTSFPNDRVDKDLTFSFPNPPCTLPGVPPGLETPLRAPLPPNSSGLSPPVLAFAPAPIVKYPSPALASSVGVPGLCSCEVDDPGEAE